MLVLLILLSDIFFFVCLRGYMLATCLEMPALPTRLSSARAWSPRLGLPCSSQKGSPPVCRNSASSSFKQKSYSFYPSDLLHPGTDLLKLAPKPVQILTKSAALGIWRPSGISCVPWKLLTSEVCLTAGPLKVQLQKVCSFKPLKAELFSSRSKTLCNSMCFLPRR